MNPVKMLIQQVTQVIESANKSLNLSEYREFLEEIGAEIDSRLDALDEDEVVKED